MSFPLKHKQPQTVVKNTFGRHRRPHPEPRREDPRGVPRAIMKQLAAEGITTDAAAMTTRLNELLQQHRKG